MRMDTVALLAAPRVPNIPYTILIPYVPYLERQLGLDVLTIGGIFAGFAPAKMLSSRSAFLSRANRHGRRGATRPAPIRGRLYECARGCAGIFARARAFVPTR
jgi:hypothetical protein